MRDDILDERQRAALRALSVTASRGFYLAGGTGLAMHLAHRRSVDIDLFRTESFDADAMVRELLDAGVPLEAVATSRSTVHAVVGGVRTSLLSFAYPLLEPPQMSPENVPVGACRHRRDEDRGHRIARSA